MDLDLSAEEQSLLELVRAIAKRNERSDPRQWWAALESSGVLEVDLSTAEGAVQAAVVAEGLGEAVAPVAFAARLTAQAVLERAEPSDARDRLEAALRTDNGSALAVGYDRTDGFAYVEALGESPRVALLRRRDGWAVLDVQDAEMHSSAVWEAAPVTAVLRYGSDAPGALTVPGPDWNELNIGLHAAELVGVVREAIARTSKYLAQREQFGRPIGSFQALQHRTVDIVSDLRASEGIIEYALWQWASRDQATPDVWIRAAVGLVAESSVKALRECFQFHGGIAMTDEFWLHHWLRRGTRLSTFQGVPAAHFRIVGNRVRDGATLEVPLATV